ncbi:hypothetical protein GHK92_10840 [Nocardioides sp. dk4132]|uniref:hypothetical protein n=1 Tax=unclassified Nocardioides TaxID=2615069 RepID=UPI001297B095|nr:MULTISPECIES: hypothetical protein [unclassified Nocardioides]MQW76374.1 hypothetical protein [Nocardioides sp. dk4132]QGA07350.1 hypothetical protein GFH29_08085 [Nocardioides sp. dk884]
MADTRTNRSRPLLAPALGLLVAVGGLTGCGDAASEVVSAGDVEVLVAEPLGGVMDALLTGRLVVVDGCLGVEGEEAGDRMVVIWPHGTEVIDAAGPAIDVPGEGEIGIGDAVHVGGGAVDDGSGAGIEVPQPCRDSPLWLASGS